jgi:hypothetical protein
MIHRCTKCQTTKPVSEFRKDSRRISGLQSWCISCGSISKKNKRKQNKQKAVDYKGGCCKRCGIVSECLDIYDFHHINPNEKEDSLNRLMNSTWEYIVPELDKCDLLCSNCHKITHWEIRNNL